MRSNLNYIFFGTLSKMISSIALQTFFCSEKIHIRVLQNFKINTYFVNFYPKDHLKQLFFSNFDCCFNLKLAWQSGIICIYWNDFLLDWEASHFSDFLFDKKSNCLINQNGKAECFWNLCDKFPNMSHYSPKIFKYNNLTQRRRLSPAQYRRVFRNHRI